MSPVLSKLYHDGYFSAVSCKQNEVFDAAVKFAKAEGILPAPESSHAIKAALDCALKCKEEGVKKVIVFGLSGTGYFDMTAYDSRNKNTMSDEIPSDGDLEKGFAALPDV
jgi:tryptophan synthase beta chain